MWRTYLIITLTVLLLKSLAKQNPQDEIDVRRDDGLLRLLSGNGLYNPLDPTGFIFEDNKKQYTGNGVDTQRFDPDNYAFKYSGLAFGSAEKQFVPSFMNANSISISPNYAHPSAATSQLASDHNATKEITADKNRTDETTNTFSNLPVASGSSPASKIPEFLSQTFPDNIKSMLKMNASNMFPNVKFSGLPGMLGIGSQVQVQVVRPVNSPIQNHQYLPPSLRNVSETHISSPTYDQFVRIRDRPIPSFGIKPNSSSISKPLYTGYPGMLGAGQMFQSIDSSGSDPKLENNEDLQIGYLNREVTSHPNNTEQDNGFKFISAKAGVNTNNWKGEWPGKTSNGGDWSGDWSEKWPKIGNSMTDDKGSQDTSKNGGFTGQQNTKVDWDGSWPVSPQTETTSTKPSNDLGDLGETISSLKKLMGILRKLNSSVDNRSNKSSPTSFSQMVSGWKEEMKS